MKASEIAATWPGLSEEKTCHDRRFSVARWVTPYGREALWLSDNSAAMALLSSAEAVAGGANGDGKPQRKEVRLLYSGFWWIFV